MIAASVRRLLVLVVLLAAGSAVYGAADASAADCPRISFLEYRGYVYRSYGIPSNVTLPAGDSLGTATVDEPGGDDGCKRGRRTAAIRSYQGIDPLVAVAVNDRPGLVFILGNKCYGLVGDDRWSCLTKPLVFEGRTYVGTAYPAKPPPRRTLSLGAPVGKGSVDQRRVSVRPIDGVDPSIAVALAGRPSEAFLVPGVCPYVGFDNRLVLDNLSRCLRGPAWTVFSPPGATPGDQVRLRADRPLKAGQRIQVALALADVGGDILPRNTAGTTVGTLTAGTKGKTAVTFTLPKLKAGRYQAVLTCPGCAAAYGGRTVFPGGTFIVGESGGSSGKVIVVALALALLVALLAALYVRRKGWTGRGRRGPGKPLQ